MCNLYAMRRARAEAALIAKAMLDRTSNEEIRPEAFPDYAATIITTGEGGQREMMSARWGLPSPKFALEGRNADKGITNVRNTSSPHWRRWLGVKHRCVVPFTSFSEFNKDAGGDVWFALSEERPIAYFAGIWVPSWTSVRKIKTGEETIDLFGFLTTEPNAEVRAVHPKAMPVILTNLDDIDTWLWSPWEEAAALQRPLPDGTLQIVNRGTKSDPLPA